MFINIKKFIAVGFALCTILLLPEVYGADRGTPEKDLPADEKHPYAGYLGIPNVGSAGTCESESLFFSCGGSLVDLSSISPDLAPLTGRLFLTAGHCVQARDQLAIDFNLPFIIYFGDLDPRVVGLDPGCPTRVTGFKTGPGFTGFYNVGFNSWSTYDFGGSGIGVGFAKDDWAIILLALNENVRVPANIAYDPLLDLTKDDVPILGLAGYGIAGWGDPTKKNSLGKPLVIDGPREKMYIEMPTKSIQNTNILSDMTAAQAEQTACNGDSGSALVHPEKVDGRYLARGLVANGDFNCRATNTATRVDTDEFRQFILSIKDEILDAAN